MKSNGPLSSEIQLLKVGWISEISEKCPDPRQDFVSGASKSVHPKNILLCQKICCHAFFLREISELTDSRDFIFGRHHRMYLLHCEKFYFVEILGFSDLFRWFSNFTSLKQVNFLSFHYRSPLIHQAENTKSSKKVRTKQNFNKIKNFTM